MSQGVLYRHFRSRVDLAVAVFEENVATIIRASNMHVHPEDRFHAAWKQMVDLTVSHVAFIETVAESALDPRIEDLSEEIRVFLRPVLAEAQASGAAPADITLETLFVALRASYGLVTTHPISEGSARDEVEGLLRRRWACRRLPRRAGQTTKGAEDSMQAASGLHANMLAVRDVIPE